MLRYLCDVFVTAERLNAVGQGAVVIRTSSHAASGPRGLQPVDTNDD